jgi:hypothetical protein
MAERTLYLGGTTTTATAGANAAGFPAYTVFENVVVCSKLKVAAAQNDVIPALSIPAGTLIQGVMWEVERVEGAARNFAVGDGDDTDGFVPSTSANSAVTGCTALALTEGGPNTVTGYSAGKYYGAADTIDILAVTSGGLVNAKIRVKAYGLVFGK